MNNTTEIQRLLDEAKSLSESGERAEATRIANQVVAKDPQNADAYYILGTNVDLARRGFEKQRLLQAIGHLTRAINIDPLHVKAHMALAQRYPVTSSRENDNYEKALAEYKKVIEIAPDYSEVYEKRGHLHSRKNRYDLAIADFSKAINLSPENANLYASRGGVFLSKEQYEEARADLNKALSLDSKNTHALHLILSTSEKKLDFFDLNFAKETVEEYERHISISKSPKAFGSNEFRFLSSMYERLGIICAEHGEYAQAVEKYKKSIEYSGEPEIPVSYNAEVHCLLGKAYSELGEYKQAIVEFDKASKHPGRHYDRHSDSNEGRSNALLKLIEKQEKDFQKKIEGFLSGPNSIFELQDRFLAREQECNTHYRNFTKRIGLSLFLTFLTVVLGIGVIGFGIYQTSGFVSIERNVFSLLPYLGIILLLAAVPVWRTRILLRSRDRWQILQEDCFRKAAIMQYLQATGDDREFRNQIILETIKHMANRGGSDLLLALHSDDPGMLYPVTDVIEKVLKKRSAKR